MGNISWLTHTTLTRFTQKFQEQLLGVVGYVISHKSTDELLFSIFPVQTFEGLTKKLCELTARNPALGIPVLCEYWIRFPLSISGLETVYETLDALKEKADQLGYKERINKSLKHIDSVGNASIMR